VVYVVDSSNHVQQRDVQVGIEGSKLAEIKSGLNPGDRVIVGGQEKYQAGEEVSPELESTQASETVQESGGMIDMKGEENAASEDGGHAAAGPGPTINRPAENGPGKNEPRDHGSKAADQNPGGAR